MQKTILDGSIGAITLLVVSTVLLVVATADAEIIPPTRRIVWDPGIPGGIPHRTTTFTNLTDIDSTGATDVTAAIQKALDECPSNQVVQLPAGKFRIDGGLVMPSYVTLRGSGAETVLLSRGAVAGLVQFGTSGVQWIPTSITTSISTGAAVGSTRLTLESSEGILVGTYLVITELNDPAYVSIDGTCNGPATWVDGWNTKGARARGQIVEVTSVDGNDVHFRPPLYSPFVRTPWATRFEALCKWSGVEDLKTYASNTGTERNFLFQCAAYCWVQNVECDYADGDHVTLDWSYRCEVRHSYFHDAFIHAAGNFDSMIGLRSKTTACLVIDNVIRRLHIAVMCLWGASGNVIAYNYDEGHFNQAAESGGRWLPPSLVSNHGAHPQFNLFEGNISQKFQADSYWGSSSDTTLFRNYFSGIGVAHPPYVGRGDENTNITVVLNQANRAIDLWELQARYNLVGNVIGAPAAKPHRVVRKVVNPASRGYDRPRFCLSYGYTAESSGGGKAFENPITTVLEHGNYDVASDGIVWDPAIKDRSLPASLFLRDKPAWFGSLPFPPIDPGRPRVAPTDIPAGYRYVHGVDPTP